MATDIMESSFKRSIVKESYLKDNITKPLFGKIDALKPIIESRLSNNFDPISGVQHHQNTSLSTHLSNHLNSSKEGNLGVIHIRGLIVPEDDFYTQMGMDTSLLQLERSLSQFQIDPTISRVILKVDSPGGIAQGLDEAFQLLQNFSKPLDAYVSGYATSASYYLASGADAIYASSEAHIGSLGTMMTVLDYTELYKNMGIEEITLVSDLSKDKNPDVKSEKFKTSQTKIMNAITKTFLENVAIGRKKGYQTVYETFGQGDVFSAEEALARGMIDGIKTYGELINQRGNMDPETTTKNLTNTENKTANQTSKTPSGELQKLQEAREEGFQSGVAHENARLRTIEMMATPEAKELVESAKQDTNIKPEDLAMSIIAYQKKNLATSFGLALKEGFEMEQAVGATSTEDVQDEKEKKVSRLAAKYAQKRKGKQAHKVHEKGGQHG